MGLSNQIHSKVFKSDTFAYIKAAKVAHVESCSETPDPAVMQSPVFANWLFIPPSCWF